MSERKALGRGISSLIPGHRRTLPPDSAALLHTDTSGFFGSKEVPIASIRLNPRQPRKQISQTGVEDLAQSIRKAGVLQPLLVRIAEKGYELIAGERRLRAAQIAGLSHVPVWIKKSNDQDQLEMALIENLQREDLSCIEEANGYEQLAREFGLTQEEIADRVGKKRSTVTNLLRLLKLSPLVREMLHAGAISMGHARALLPIEETRRQEVLAHKIEQQGLSVRQVESMVRKMLAQSKSVSPRRSTDSSAKSVNVRHLAEELQRALGTRVHILAKAKGGEIRISYYGTEDLKRLFERLVQN